MDLSGVGIVMRPTVTALIANKRKNMQHVMLVMNGQTGVQR